MIIGGILATCLAIFFMRMPKRIESNAFPVSLLCIWTLTKLNRVSLLSKVFGSQKQISATVKPLFSGPAVSLHPVLSWHQLIAFAWTSQAKPLSLVASFYREFRKMMWHAVCIIDGFFIQQLWPAKCPCIEADLESQGMWWNISCRELQYVLVQGM